MESPFMRAVVSCDEALALALLGGGSAAALDAVDGTSGYTALHYAAEYGLCELARSLVAAGAALDAATKDLVLQNAVVQSGGQTPLMLAARTGEAGIARALLVAGAGARAEDWDGIDAATAAVLCGRRGLGEEIYAAGCAAAGGVSAGERRPLVCAADMAAVRAAAAVRARARAAADLDVPETLRAAYTLPRFWSAARCGQVLDALHAEVARRADDHGDGWSDGRHRAFATNDLPVALVPQIDALCRAWLRADVFPHLVRRHGWGSTDRLDFRDLFFVRYSASPGRQRGLPLHRDGSVVSFNVLLSDPQSFQGGGTYVEADNCVYAIGRGDVFVHAGKLRHGAAPVTAGERIVLVAFVDVAPTADAAPDTPPS